MPDFRPQLWPSLAALLMVPLFIHLGLWQAGKAERKAALQATLDQRLAAAPVALPAPAAQPEDQRYLRVQVRGRYDAAHSLLLDNQIHQGRAGFHVLTPLRLEQGGLILVNRGWTPFSGDRSRLPQIAVPSGVVALSGHLLPPPPARLEARFYPQPGRWSALWPALDLPRLAAEMGPLPPWVLRLDPAPAEAGLTRAWERPDARVGMHRGYALQWFLLAGGLALAWLGLSFQRKAVE
ncbi:MAG: SURF1 family protein [Betaproteobacteria bacterium]|nr:SURF1 family protein [Betaproteobacteria bacterium]